MTKGRKPRHWSTFPDDLREYLYLFTEQGALTFPGLSRGDAYLLRNQLHSLKNAIFRALEAGEQLSTQLSTPAKDMMVTIQPEIGSPDTYLLMVRKSIASRIVEGAPQSTPSDEDYITVRKVDDEAGNIHIYKYPRPVGHNG
jgi:hypothetical protein